MINYTPLNDLPANTRYYFEATGFNGEVYRVRIIDDQGYIPDPDRVTFDEAFIDIQKGQSDQLKQQTILPTTVDMRLRDPSVNLDDLFSATDDRYEVEIVDKQFDLMFRGYLLTDFFEIDRYSASPVARLTASDGLSLLKGRTFNINQITPINIQNNTFDGQNFYAPLDIIKYLLPNRLPVQCSLEWERRSETGDVSSYLSDQILDGYIGISEAAFNDEITHFQLLENILATYGLQLQQTTYDLEDYATPLTGRTAVWHIIPRYQVATSSNNRIFRYENGENFSEYDTTPTTTLLNNDQNNILFQNNARATFDRRLNTSTLSFEFGDVDQLISNSGFETGDFDSWTTYTNATTTLVLQRSNQTQDNQFWVRSSFSASDGVVFPYVSQNVEALGNNIIDFDVSFFANIRANPSNDAMVMDIIPTVDGQDYYLEISKIALADTYLEGEEFEMALASPLKGPIPEGASIPVFDDGNPGSIDYLSDIEVIERGETGDTSIVVTSSQAFLSGDDVIVHWYYSDTEPSKPGDPESLNGPFWVRDLFRTQEPNYEFRFTNELPNGDRFQNFELKFYILRPPVDGPGGVVDPVIEQDDIEVTLVDKVNTKLIQTSSPLQGDDISRTALSGVPPSKSGNDANRTVAIEYDAQDNATAHELDAVRFQGGDWKSDLLAVSNEQYVATFAQHNEQVTLNIQRKNGEPFLRGHERVLFDNRVWSIASLRTNVSEGIQNVSLAQLDTYDNIPLTTTRIIGGNEL